MHWDRDFAAVSWGTNAPIILYNNDMQISDCDLAGVAAIYSNLDDCTVPGSITCP